MFTVQEQVHSTSPFKEKIVHFDLKGAPPNLNYYNEIFPLLKQMKVNAILIEYEDMFPYWNELSVLKRTISYTTSDLKSLLQLAFDNDLEVIPLVQTFGHMEFVLKHPEYSAFREDAEKPDTICPSDYGSWLIISEMLRQIRTLHPDAKRLHIGADEAYSLGKDTRCSDRLIRSLNASVERLKLEHITKIAKFARKKLGFVEVLAWNDMFAETDIVLLNDYKMGELIVPVIWGYAVDVTKFNYFPKEMFSRYSKVFPQMMFASAFKGANGQSQPFCNISRYLANQRSYVELYKLEKKHLEGKISGIILTGWQRYNHFYPLCEILPVSIPSLVADLIYLNNTDLNESEVVQRGKEFLSCTCDSNNGTVISKNITGKQKVQEEISVEAMFMNCSFPGSKVYDEMEKLHRSCTNDELSTLDFKKVQSNISNFLQPYFYAESIKEILEEQLTPWNIGMGY